MSDVCSSDLATVDRMSERRFGRIVNITSAAVKAPIEILGLSNGARAGLTGFVAGLARKTVRHNVTINGLLPGPFATDRFHDNIRFQAKKTGVSYEELLEKRKAENPAGRVGDRSEEHTSELQSLMRNSYAVFCLKKKKIHTRNTAQKHK